MKILGTHIYVGANPDKNLTEHQKNQVAASVNTPSQGPKKIIPGVYVGGKSIKKLLENQARQNTGDDAIRDMSKSAPELKPSSNNPISQHSIPTAIPGSSEAPIVNSTGCQDQPSTSHTAPEAMTPSKLLFGKSSRQLMQEIYGKESPAFSMANGTIVKASAQEVAKSILDDCIVELANTGSVQPNKRLAALLRIFAKYDGKLGDTDFEGEAKANLVLRSIDMLVSLAQTHNQAYTKKQMAQAIDALKQISDKLGLDATSQIKEKISENENVLLPVGPGMPTI